MCIYNDFFYHKYKIFENVTNYLKKKNFKGKTKVSVDIILIMLFKRLMSFGNRTGKKCIHLPLRNLVKNEIKLLEMDQYSFLIVQYVCY